jgi:serine/threonine protein kinase
MAAFVSALRRAQPLLQCSVVSSRNLGKYRIIAELGHGGMAEVFLSLITGPLGSGFTKLAVIKRLHPHLAEDPDFIAMLVDEARISARLNHANVVQTLEVGVENDQYFLAMEFLDGQPLHRIQRRSKKTGAVLSADLEYLIIADALAGLQHAHELSDYDGTPLGIVHRDVTPQNIFVTYDGQVKVVDFGIAKAAGRASETRQGIVKGKVRYMSPEQAMGSPVDCRSDVFAAGVLVWEAATKKHLWGELDELAIVQKLISGDFDASPQTVDPSVPTAIDAICRKALARDPADRYPSAADFRADLEAFLAAGVVGARRRLAALVADMFVKERRTLRGVIEQSSKESFDPMSLAALAASQPTTTLMSGASSSSSGNFALLGLGGETVAPWSHHSPVSSATNTSTLSDASASAQVAGERAAAGDSAVRAKRFHMGTAASFLAIGLAMLVVTAAGRADRFVGGSGAARLSFSRETAQVVVAHTSIVHRATRLRKTAAAEHATEVAATPIAWVTSAAAGHDATATIRTTEPAPRGVGAADRTLAAAQEAPAPATRGRARPVIDTADPWSRDP